MKKKSGVYDRIMASRRPLSFNEPVLVRDNDTDIWMPDVFVSRDMKDEYSYRCRWNVWKQCIPLEGNLNFLGSNRKHY